MRGFHCIGCKYGRYTPSLIMKAYVFECMSKGGCPRTTPFRRGGKDDKGRVQKTADDN